MKEGDKIYKFDPPFNIQFYKNTRLRFWLYKNKIKSKSKSDFIGSNKKRVSAKSTSQ